MNYFAPDHIVCPLCNGTGYIFTPCEEGGCPEVDDCPGCSL